MEVGALADMLKSGPSTPVSTKQSAQPWRVIYGQARVGGSMVFESTTGHQLNRLIVWASHPCQQVTNVYLDKKQLFYKTNNGEWGDAAGGTRTTEEGNSYDFGGLVFVEHRFGHPGQLVRDSSGTLAPHDWMTSLQGNDGLWDPAHKLYGHCYSYVKTTASADQFPSGEPNAKATITGKCDIWDPRTNTYGYTTNAALCIADFMTNKVFGMGMPWSEIDLDELVASANVCDEQVLLANGSYENRYSLNGTFTTDTSRSDILQSMLDSCAGRTAYIGGKHRIIVGYDRGASLQFDENDFTGDIEWSSQLGSAGRFNEVQPVFICPRYPYQTAGNYYNADNPVQNTFDGAWQATSAPPYSLSDARRYSLYPLTDNEGNPILDGNGNQELGDAFMAEDNGQRLTTDLKLQFVISVGQAQRLARIKLMRHRQMGRGTLPLKLSGLKTCALDNVLVSYAPFGWVNKEVEVSEWRFVFRKGQDGKGFLLESEIDVVETDPAATYHWSIEEELAMNAPDYLLIADAAQVENPAGLAMESGLDSAVVTSDGIVHPRIKVTWTAPTDPLITSGGYINLQYRPAGGEWLNGPALTGDATLCYVPNVVQGQSYDCRIRAVSMTGGQGSWVEDDGHVVSATTSVITTGSLNPNSPANTSDTSVVDSIAEGSAATIRIYGPGGDGSSWTRYVASLGIVEPAAHITGLAFSTSYYVVFDVQTGNFQALTSYIDALADNYYALTSSLGITTCDAPSTGTGGGTSSGGGTTGGGGRNPITVTQRSEQ